MLIISITIMHLGNRKLLLCYSLGLESINYLTFIGFYFTRGPNSALVLLVSELIISNQCCNIASPE